ncbi:MAG: HIT family hydrolase [Deltaproteobacteria bacterium RIFCSPLOWO2_12_FULL_60_19]|nr:MAG: HIT family hydrolase [Deltaproteobacteria bacterium RIFCSPLOWO2_12_FULL_60_19]
MKSLWAPWRMTYIEQGKTAGCIFCDQPRAVDARAGLVLTQSAHAVVMLNKYPYNSGHLLVAPKRHVDQLSSLSPQEHQDLCETLRMSVDVLRDELRPGGFNLGMNLGRCAGAGVEDHLHWHVVPRWEGDTNFMPLVGEVRVIPQHLLDSYDRLSPLFKNVLA